MISVENYNKKRGIYSPLIEHNGIICGFWLCGNDYHNTSDLYGAYPPSYLKRMNLLFPNSDRTLHLFAGSVQRGEFDTSVTFDLRPNYKPDIQGNAEDIATYFPEKYFDLILADPPYDDNHLKYGTPKVNKQKTIKGCVKILKSSGHLVWLDTIIPIWAKADGWKLRGTIGLVQSTNHKVRVITILEKIKIGRES